MAVPFALQGPFDRPDPDLPDWLDDDVGDDDTRDPGDAEPIEPIDLPSEARLGPEEEDEDDTRDPGEEE